MLLADMLHPALALALLQALYLRILLYNIYFENMVLFMKQIFEARENCSRRL
jgi:hypothetical protein